MFSLSSDAVFDDEGPGELRDKHMAEIWVFDSCLYDERHRPGQNLTDDAIRDYCFAAFREQVYITRK
jgi:hypothetical protein